MTGEELGGFRRSGAVIAPAAAPAIFEDARKGSVRGFSGRSVVRRVAAWASVRTCR